jgi:hypothetical protein
VIGNDAWIGGVIRSSNDPSGDGAGAPPDVTTFHGIGSLAQTQAFCDNHPAYRFPFTIDGGNIQVRS